MRMEVEAICCGGACFGGFKQFLNIHARAHYRKIEAPDTYSDP